MSFKFRLKYYCFKDKEENIRVQPFTNGVYGSFGEWHIFSKSTFKKWVRKENLSKTDLVFIN